MYRFDFKSQNIWESHMKSEKHIDNNYDNQSEKLIKTSELIQLMLIDTSTLQVSKNFPLDFYHNKWNDQHY